MDKELFIESLKKDLNQLNKYEDIENLMIEYKMKKITKNHFNNWQISVFLRKTKLYGIVTKIAY